MSDDQPQNTAVEAMQTETTERNIKSEPSTVQETVIPLSQQAEPPKDGTFMSIVQKIKHHDEAMLKNGILYSALPKGHRDEYNSLIQQRDASIEAIYSHTQLMKEEEADFADQNPDAWKNDFINAEGEEFQKAIAYCAAASKMHARNIQEKNALKRRIEELENDKKASPSPPQPKQEERKVHTTGNAIGSFTEKASTGQQQQQQPNNSNNKPNENALKIKAFDKMSHNEDFMDNPERPENKLGAKFISNSFGWFGKPLTTNK